MVHTFVEDPPYRCVSSPSPIPSWISGSGLRLRGAGRSAWSARAKRPLRRFVTLGREGEPPSAGEAAQQEAHHGDDEGAQERVPEAVDVKAQAQPLGDGAREQEHQRIDHEGEQTQGQDLQGQTEEDDDGPDDRIHHAEDEGDQHQHRPVVAGGRVASRAEPDAGHEPGRHEEGHRVDEPADEKVHAPSYPRCGGEGGLMTDRPSGDVIVGEHYYILASDVATDVPKLVLQHDDAFLVTDRRGDLPQLPRSEFGFYVDGARFLRQCELRVYDQRPIVLNAGVSGDALQIAVDLTNADVALSAQIVLPGRAMRVARRLTLYRRRLYQSLRVETFARVQHELKVTLHLSADYVDVFEIRGHPRPQRGELLAPRLEDDRVRFAYRGLDRVTRVTEVVFDPPPRRLEAGMAEYVLALTPGTPVEIEMVATAFVDAEVHPPALVFDEAAQRRHTVVAGLEHEAAR